jgi:methylamine dehydrogenase accessory protein MauD
MSMTALTVMVIVLFVMVLGLSIAVFALSRQVGILFERVAPMGALIIDAGPKVGAASPIFDVPTLNGGRLKLGGASERSTLLFFLSPTCPVCKKLLPVLRSMRPAEAQWLDVVLASDGDSATHERFAQANSLQTFPYVLSTELGVSFRVSRLPFAVLLDEQGIVRAKGLINNREQLESLFSAKELGIESIQSYLEQAA